MNKSCHSNVKACHYNDEASAQLWQGLGSTVLRPWHNRD